MNTCTGTNARAIPYTRIEGRQHVTLQWHFRMFSEYTLELGWSIVCFLDEFRCLVGLDTVTLPAAFCVRHY